MRVFSRSYLSNGRAIGIIYMFYFDLVSLCWQRIVSQFPGMGWLLGLCGYGNFGCPTWPVLHVTCTRPVSVPLYPYSYPRVRVPVLYACTPTTRQSTLCMQGHQCPSAPENNHPSHTNLSPFPSLSFSLFPFANPFIRQKTSWGLDERMS